LHDSSYLNYYSDNTLMHPCQKNVNKNMRYQALKCQPGGRLTQQNLPDMNKRPNTNNYANHQGS
jgi:hypothetical protein